MTYWTAAAAYPSLPFFFAASTGSRFEFRN
jgi:hypothetical protein